MATNKHAMIRYQALDACFSNFRKRYFIDDLIEACNKALSEFYISKEDKINDTEYFIRRRTIFNDIRYMKSDEGWGAPIETYYEGRRCYYRYSDENFSIYKKDFTATELNKLEEAIAMLDRFNGKAGFDWISEFIANFKDKLGRQKNEVPVVGYEVNQYLQGIEYLTELYNHIVRQQVLKITYRPFSKDEIVYEIHPYFLKQYNNRWFLFGITEADKNSLVNLPLDRIVQIEPVRKPYIPNTTFDFEEYFDDVVGVSVPKGGAVEEILLQFCASRFPYVQTKPIHPTQSVVDKDNGIVRLKVIPNLELESVILSFGNQVEVLEPSSLRDRIALQVGALYKKYKSAE